MMITKLHATKWKVFKGHLVLVFLFLRCTHCALTFLAWVPICVLYRLVRHIWLLAGFGQKTMLYGVFCALAAHHRLTAPHFISGLCRVDLALSPFLTVQHCQINHVHAHLKTDPSPPPTSIQGITPQKALVQIALQLEVLRDLRVTSKPLQLNHFRLNSLLVNQLPQVKVS